MLLGRRGRRAEPFPEDATFAFHLLYDALVPFDEAHRFPLGKLFPPADPFDELAATRRVIASVRVRGIRNLPSDLEELSNWNASRWRKLERLPVATYTIKTRTSDFTRHVKRGARWESTAYSSEHVPPRPTGAAPRKKGAKRPAGKGGKTGGSGKSAKNDAADGTAANGTPYVTRPMRLEGLDVVAGKRGATEVRLAELPRDADLFRRLRECPRLSFWFEGLLVASSDFDVDEKRRTLNYRCGDLARATARTSPRESW